jgi:hypothetical protein
VATKGNIPEPERFACGIALEIRTESMITAQRCQDCKLDEERPIVSAYGCGQRWLFWPISIDATKETFEKLEASQAPALGNRK